MQTSALPAVLPALLIGSLSLLTPVLTPPSVQFGVRVPAERAGDPVVAAARRTYRIGVGAVTVVAVLAGWFVASSQAAIPTALLIEFGGSLAAYLVARSHVAEAKRDGRWFQGRTQVTVTDTTLRTRPEPFPWLWVLPAAVITSGTAIVGAIRYPRMPDRLVSHYDGGGHPTSYTDKNFGSAFALVLAQIGITALIVAVSWATARGKAQLDAQDPHAARRHRRFVTAMARCLLVLAAAVDLSMFFGALAMWKLTGSTGVFVVLLPAPIMLATAGLIVVSVRFGQGGSRLRFAEDAPGGGSSGDSGSGGSGSGDSGSVSTAAKAGGTVNRDDDRFWKLGIFYANREDPSVFVQKRFGVGWTVNFARPATVGVFVGIVAVGLLFGTLLGSH